MSDEHAPDEPRGSSGSSSDGVPWPQKALDNLWLLLVLSIVVPVVLYLAWGLVELGELPTWGGG